MGDERELQRRLIDRERVRWQVGKSECLGVGDLAFGAPASAVERLEEAMSESVSR